MDPKDQKIKELTDQLAAKTTEVETITKERDTLKTDAETKATEIEGLKKTVQEKDVVIEQKNNDIVGARKKYSEMSDADKAKLTESEAALAQQMEDLEKKQAEFNENQANFQKEQRETARDAAIKALVGNDPKAIELVKFNFDQLKDSETLSKPEDIQKAVTNAYNMLGEDKPAPVAAAHGAGGGQNPGDTGGGDDFSGTEEGKGLASILNLTQTQQPPAPANPPAPAPAPETPPAT